MQSAIIERSTAALEFLAADRPEETSEIFTPNDFYGHASILKRYCGLPADFKIPAVIPHGVSINHSSWQVELNAPLSRIYAMSEEQRSKYQNVTDKQVHVIGSAILYAERMLADEVAEIRSTASGTVAFPAHSTHHLTAEFDQDAFIQSMHDLPDEMKPVSICMYWRDIQLNRHVKYLEHGFDCVTAGHMFDHEFHDRLIRILASHKYSVTNAVGTSSVFAASFGLKAHLVEQDQGVHGSSQFLSEHAPKITQPSAVHLMESMLIPPGQDRPDQKKWADIATGREFVQTPEQLKDLILQHSKPAISKPRPAKITRTWDQEVKRLETMGSFGCAGERKLIFPDGKPFEFIKATRLIEDHEIWQMEGVFSDLANLHPALIIDCGSDTGYTSIRMAQNYPEAQIFGFEADPQKAKIQFRNLDSMGLHHVALNSKAVWTESGLVSFQTSENETDSQISQVPSIRLKSLLHESKVDLLRLNIATAALPVIQDCAEDLRNVRHLVIHFPVAGSQRDELILLLAQLSAIGFHLQLNRVVFEEESETDLRILITGHCKE